MDNFNEEDYTSIHGLNKESSYMIVDRIIESIGVKAFEVVQNILQSKGEQKIGTIIDQRSQKQFLDRFKENLDNDLLQKYGDEQLYDDLCKVLLEKDNLIRLLKRQQNLSITDEQTDEEFVDRVMEGVTIKIYNRGAIKTILLYIAEKAFESFNALHDRENINLKNIIVHEGIKMQHELAIANSKNDKILQRIDKIETIVSSTKEDTAFLSVSKELNSGDIDKFCSGAYEIKVKAKNQANYFKMTSEIKVSVKNFPFENFQEFISYLGFSGKSEIFEVCRMQLVDSQGNTLKEYEDKSYSGMKFKLPEVYVDEIEWNQIDIEKMVVQIAPQFDFLSFQIEDNQGDILIQNKKYKIERESDGEIIIAHLRDLYSTEQLITNFDVEICESKPFSAITHINVQQRDPSSLSSNITFCNLMQNIYDSKIIVGRDIGEDRVIWRGGGFSTESDQIIEKIKIRSRFYKNLRKLENYFGVQFTIPDIVEPEEMVNAKQVCDLLDKGIVSVDIGKITITPEQFTINDGKLEDFMGEKNISLLYYYKEITVLNVKIPAESYFRVVNFIKSIHFDDEKNIEMKCTKAYIYNEKLATLSETEIINNLANGRMYI